LIPCQRANFDIPADVAYLNCAYMGPLSHRVVAAGIEGAKRKARPWNLPPRAFFDESERARGLFARLIGSSADDVAIVPSASYGLAVAARNLPLARGQTVVVPAEQFPSNLYVWRESAKAADASIVTVAAPGDGDWTAAILQSLDTRTGVVALPHCRWTDGALLDLAAIGRRCRQIGAALAIDATQSLGALPLDLAAVDPDFLVTAGYKWLLGPYSLSFLYAAPRRQAGKPLEYNWINRQRSEDFARLVDYRDEYQAGARRYDMGERSNFAAMPAAIAALEQLLEWEVPRIQATLAAFNRAIAERARGIGLQVPPEHLRAGHFLGLGFPKGPPEGLVERLAERQVFVSLRGASLRVTPHLYNTPEDVDRLFAALAS